MLLLIVGVFLVSWTRGVKADPLVTRQGSYSLTVSVPGPPPSQAAIIDVPHEGQKFTSQPITVSGDCPVDTYEVLYRNGAFSGVALCDYTGHYSMTTGLFPGNNQLKVRDFSPTDVAGPWSNTVNVSYNPSQPVTPPSTGEPGNNPSTTNSGGPKVYGEPLIFKTNFVYTGHYVGQATTWQLDIEGGEAPYAVSVDWGDGAQSLVSRSRAGNFTITHIYQKPGSGYRGSYVTKFTASDQNGNLGFLQLMAIVNNPPSSTAHGHAGIGSTNGNGQSGSSGGILTKSYLLTILKYVWSSYLFAVLLLLSFWLGERREYQRLKPLLKNQRKRVRHA